MIGTIDIRLNAAKPNFPLSPFYAFLSSPSQVRVINVPRSIGSWDITAVYVTANYPDNQSASVACSLDGGCWHATLPASTATGSSTNGFTITADGLSEDGETTVTGYVLGKGDLTILDTDGSITVGDTTYYVHLVDEEPETPHKGDLCAIDGVYKLYDGSAWETLGGLTSVAWDNITGKPYLNKLVVTSDPTVYELVDVTTVSSNAAIAELAEGATGDEVVAKINEIIAATQE